MLKTQLTGPPDDPNILVSALHALSLFSSLREFSEHIHHFICEGGFKRLFFPSARRIVKQLSKL
jgi:hypothetical protein